jgi:hypothetical protein
MNKFKDKKFAAKRAKEKNKKEKPFRNLLNKRETRRMKYEPVL